MHRKLLALLVCVHYPQILLESTMPRCNELNSETLTAAVFGDGYNYCWHAPDHSMRLSSGPLEAIKHLRLSSATPATSSETYGLDFVRCSSLHNAIIRHQWQDSGYELDGLPITTWWQRSEYTSQLDKVGKYLPGSLIEFSKLALQPEGYPEHPNRTHAGLFFYIAPCLASPEQAWHEVDSDIGEIERVALYLTDTEISDITMDGVMWFWGSARYERSIADVGI